MVPAETPPPQKVDLYGTGAGGTNPIAGLSAVSLTFGNQQRSTTSSSQIVTLVNAGGGPLNTSGIAASANFAVSSACPSSLASGASCTIAVSFQPAASTMGTLTGAITITDNNNGTARSVQTISLTGKATP
jgi:hypothetical protein